MNTTAMKKVLLILTALIYLQSSAQNKWFETYTDSILLTRDANKIVQQFASKIEQHNPDIKLNNNKAIKNTTPYLIFINNATISLPFWMEVSSQQKEFFTEIARGANEGKKVFGLFFNGFYLAHELGHSLSANAGKNFDNAYDSEYEANIIAILYWKAAGEKRNLKKCYAYSKKMLKTLENPVPANEDYAKYITEHYSELASDPYKYGYIQFTQFVEIYEDKSLSNFDAFIKNYNAK